MGHDRALKPIPDDGGLDIESEYNAVLRGLEREGRGTWFGAPWLFAE